MKPSVGRIVHFWQDAECVAAVITKVKEPRYGGGCNLTTFQPDGGTRFEEGIPEGSDVGTWHWPERVD